MPLKKQIARLYRDIYIGIGTNKGDKIKNLNSCLQLLEENSIIIEKVSSVYETQAWGLKDQDSFLNQVVSVKTKYDPWSLLYVLQKIESKIGRKRSTHWGPRVIDLDILLFEQKIICENDLIIPHPYMYLRNFVLVPLAELAPDLIHPKTGLSVRELLQNCPDKGIVEKIEPKPT